MAQATGARSRCRSRNSLGLLGEPSPASAAAWSATGAAVRILHDAELPQWTSSQDQQRPVRGSRDTAKFPRLLDAECEWLIANGVLSAEAIRRNRQIAEAALRPWTPVFIHGDLQIVHVFVDGYGDDVDMDVIRSYWSLRSLMSTRWLAEHGSGAPSTFPEFAVLIALAGKR